MTQSIDCQTGECFAKGGGKGDNYTSGRGECTVDIEEADCILDGTIRQSGIDTCSFGHG